MKPTLLINAAAFHYQSDGWMSDRSAEVYEHSTETLFFGRQDAMQRSSLVPISKFISVSNKPVESMRLLEVRTIKQSKHRSFRLSDAMAACIHHVGATLRVAR